MSTLINCRACGKPVSSNAAFCPTCGERSPAPTKDTLKYGLLGLAIVIVVAVMLVSVINLLVY